MKTKTLCAIALVCFWSTATILALWQNNIDVTMMALFLAMFCTLFTMMAGVSCDD